jgi:hypothetical protein
MDTIAADLARQGKPCKDFTKRSETYREHRQELDADPTAPEGLSSALTRSAVRIGLRAAEDIPLVGPFAKELNTDAVAGQADRLRVFLNRKLRNQHDVRLMLAPVDELTPTFVDDLRSIASHHPVALFFDTYERTGAFLDPWLLDLLVGRYGDLPPNVVLTVAGQHPLDINTWGDYLGIRSDLALKVFTDAEASELLATRGVTDSSVVEVIRSLTGRLPVLVAMLADARPDKVEEVNDPSDNAVERFLKWERDEQRRVAALRYHGVWTRKHTPQPPPPPPWRTSSSGFGACHLSPTTPTVTATTMSSATPCCEYNVGARQPIGSNNTPSSLTTTVLHAKSSG